MTNIRLVQTRLWRVITDIGVRERAKECLY